MTQRPCRIFDKNTGRMLYPPDMARMGVYLNGLGEPFQLRKQGWLSTVLVKLHNVVVMYGSGYADNRGELIWEGDILDVDIPNEFGSMLVARGYMAWDEKDGAWQVELPHNKNLTEHGVDFTGCRRLGNIYQTPALLKKDA